jgi:dipeptidyl aminopeptidase/acylaminoacyl peptidase
LVYRFNDMEYLDDVVQSLYIVGIEGGEAKRLSSDAFMNSNPQWSPDGSEILYMASMHPDIARAMTARVRAVNPDTGAMREILADWGIVGAASWTPDGKSVVVIGQPDGLPIGSKNDLWVVPASGGTPENRTAGIKVGVGGGLQADMPVVLYSAIIPVAPDGKSAYVSVQEGGNVSIYRVALSGGESWQAVVKGERAAFLKGQNANRLVYVVSDINHPIDLFCSDTSGGSERQLTNINEAWLAQVKLPRIEHLLFPSSDGVQVEGWLMTPAEGAAPYPTILDIHGGPHSAYGRVFHFDTQLLCGAGYAVLMINHRASLGYGNEFSTAIKGDWGNLDYKDLMAGVDYVIAKGWADPDRLGVCGLSGGGNLSCWTVGQTRRFKAAVPENPVTNWVSFYGVSDIGVWFATEELGGHPHEIPEVYARCSPITYAHTCTTPTLLIQGEHDWRCPPEQSEQFYTVLRANGCIAEMLRLPNSSHAGTIQGAPTIRKAHNDALLGWMNKYVLGKTE